jgi:UDP-glucose 4-epimerase
VHGDVGAFEWKRALRQASVVFHLAAFVHRRPATDAECRELWRVNAEATRRLGEACRDAEVLLVLASTVTVFGSRVGPRCPGDDDAPAPDTEYGRSKLEAEETLRAMRGLAHVILRFPLLVGPHGRGNMERLLRAASRGLYWPLRGASTKKSWLSLDDAAAALLLAAEVPAARGGRYVVSRPVPDTLEDIQGAVFRAVRRPRPPFPLPDVVARGGAAAVDALLRACGCRAFARDAVRTLLGPAAYDGSRFARDTGFVPRDSLDAALSRTAAALGVSLPHA